VGLLFAAGTCRTPSRTLPFESNRPPVVYLNPIKRALLRRFGPAWHPTWAIVIAAIAAVARSAKELEGFIALAEVQ